MHRGGPGTGIQKLRLRSISGSMGSSQPRRTYGKLSGLPTGCSPARFSIELDRRCRDFIAASPFIVVGSTDPFGLVDLSPKGDSAGFVRCLDDTTPAIPDRRGNPPRRYFQNLLQNPGVRLILFVPGQRDTLRVTVCRTTACVKML